MRTRRVEGITSVLNNKGWTTCVSINVDVGIFIREETCVANSMCRISEKDLQSVRNTRVLTLFNYMVGLDGM